MNDDATAEIAETVSVPPPEPVVSPKPTSAAEWKRKSRARWLLTLPSGSTILAKRADWGRMVATGVVDLQNLAGMPNNLAELEPAQILAHLGKMIPMAQAVAREVALEPRIGSDDEDAIAFSDIEDTDVLALFAWARGVEGALVATEVV